MIVALLLVIAAGAGLAGYFAYQSYYYVKTEDARISADMVSVTPQISGRLLSWQVKEGDVVDKDTRLGLLDTSGVLSTTEVNMQAFSQSAASTAQKTDIIAPIAGKIVQSKVHAGQSVALGQTLAVIANTNDLYVTANIKETLINKVRPGQRVDVSIDAYPGKTFTGRVDSVGEAANSVFSLIPVQSSSGNFTKVTQLIPVKIRFPELSQMAVKLGMNVSVRIHIK
jgi:multidrug resistance efflux pump